MKTTTNKQEVPTNSTYLKIDFGNEFLYIFDIESKSYIDVVICKNTNLFKVLNKRSKS